MTRCIYPLDTRRQESYVSFVRKERSSMRFMISAALAASLMMGCGSGNQKNYEFTFNGCDTGQHSFESNTAYCEGLRSDALNHGCAYDLRKDAYLNECGSAFSTTN